ncbi:MAG: hypothetical protein ACOYL6_14505 [Bacteriovoracaceae bacterium]
MELISQKFKYLQEVKSLAPSLVPDFEKIENKISFTTLVPPFILRSALKKEAGLELQSGRSVTLHQLQKKDLDHALIQIQKQNDLEEVILQSEIPWCEHLTIIIEKDFFLGEKKDRQNSTTFFYQGLNGGTEDKINIHISSQIIRLQPLLKTQPLWLSEWGFLEGKIYLFQLHPVEQNKLTPLFSNDLAFQMILSRQRFQKAQGLVAMLKCEWQAFLYRRRKTKDKTFSAQDLFINWEFIFHYFRLHCLIHNESPSENALAHFFQNLHQKNFLSEIVREHFRLANELRRLEKYPVLDFHFEGEKKMRFIGKGQKTYIFGDDALYFSELLPDQVYALNSPKLILTKTISLLGHGVLAAIETGHSLVTGIPESLLFELKDGDQIYLDFETEKIELQ